MTSYSKKLSFMVPLTKEETSFAERLLEACESVLEQASWDADKAELESIYEDPDVVPPDLRDHVRNIAPDPMRGIGITVSYEEASEDDEAGMWVRHDESANINFLPLWLREIIRKFGHPDAIGFEWCSDCSSPLIGALGGGGCVVRRDGWNWLDTGDWVAQNWMIRNASTPITSFRSFVCSESILISATAKERDQTMASDSTQATTGAAPSKKISGEPNS